MALLSQGLFILLTGLATYFCTLSSTGLRKQNPSLGESSGMELDKLYIFERKAVQKGYRHTIARVSTALVLLCQYIRANPPVAKTTALALRFTTSPFLIS